MPELDVTLVDRGMQQRPHALPKAGRRPFALSALFAAFVCTQSPWAAAAELLAAPVSVSAAASEKPGTGDAAHEEAGSGLEEILVTATRRSESISRVPISISALTQQDLLDAGIKDIADVSAATPGLQFDTPQGVLGTVTTISIRGLNTIVGASVVGVYLDDTPIQTRLPAVGNIGNPYPVVFDLNRIEVARGPQGTLFGAGSEAGNIRFITNEPSLDTLSGYVHAELSSTEYGTPSYEVGAAVGGPIIPDELGFRMSIWGRHDGGYIDRVDPGTGTITANDTNTGDSIAFRAAFAFKVNDAVKISPSLFYQVLRRGDSNAFYGNFSNPSKGQFENATLLPDVANDYFTLPTLKIEAQLPFADLTSVTSYTHRNANVRDEIAALIGGAGIANYGNPLGPDFPTSLADAAPMPTQQTVNAITQELRLASNRPDAAVTWVAGAFYDHRTQTDILTMEPSLPADPSGALLGYFYQKVVDEQLAAFAQADVHLGSQWTLTLGERVARIKTDQLNLNGSGIFNSPIPRYQFSSTYTPTTPRASLAYQLDPRNMFYVSVAKGFRLGSGSNPVPDSCDVVVPPSVKPDYVWSYELGAKSALFDNRAQIAASVFHVKWSSIQQVIVPPCGVAYVTNTGNAVSDGFDFDLQTKMTDRLRVGLAVGYVNMHYTEDVLDTAGNPLVQKGDKVGLLPQVNPPWEVKATAKYDLPWFAASHPFVRGEYQFHSQNPGPFTSGIAASANYSPQLAPNPATRLFNASLGVTRDNLEATLFVDNVFNSTPLLNKWLWVPQAQAIFYNTFRPRTIGASLSYHF